MHECCIMIKSVWFWALPSGDVHLTRLRCSCLHKVLVKQSLFFVQNCRSFSSLSFMKPILNLPHTSCQFAKAFQSMLALMLPKTIIFFFGGGRLHLVCFESFHKIDPFPHHYILSLVHIFETVPMGHLPFPRLCSWLFLISTLNLSNFQQ